VIAGRPAPGAPRAIGLSAVLHALLLSWLLVARPEGRPVTAPVYRVDLVAAPPGPRAAGVVSPTPPPTKAPEPPAPTPPPVTSPPARAMPLPTKSPPRRAPAAATPTPAPATQSPPRAAAPPVAGGGPTGGQGTDVATVRTEGIEFPYPGYLENIVRQIAIRFDPPQNLVARAEIRFIIRRDGSAEIVGFVQRSGNFEFDLEAQGAIEAAARNRAFGELPHGYPGDALTVVFSFDPRTIR
jgi:protein TonB